MPAASDSSSTSSRVGRGWRPTLDRRFEGWEGVIHGGILCTILDEVMAWALVGEDNWGVTARMAVDFRRPIEVGMPIRAEGWITRSRRRIVDTAGHIVDAGTGDRARNRDRRVRRGQPRAQARPAGALRLPPDPTPRRRRDRGTRPERGHGARRRVRRGPSRAGRGTGRGPRRVHQRPRRLRDGADGRPPNARRPGVPCRPAAHRPRHRARPRRPLAAPGSRLARFSERDPAGPADTAPVRRRPALP